MSDTKGTAHHTAVYSIAALLGKAVGFVMLPFYVHQLHAIGYGVIGMLDAMSALLLALIAYNLQGALTRFYLANEDAKYRREVLSTGVLLAGALTIILCLPIALTAGPMTKLLLGDATYTPFLQLTLLAFVFDGIANAASSLLLIKRQSMLFSVVGLVRLVVSLGLNILLIVILEWGLWGYYISALAASLVSLVMFGAFFLRECPLSFNRKLARELIHYQWPLVPSALLTFLANQSERVFLRMWSGLATVGILEMAYKFPMLLSLLLTEPFARSWYPEQMRLAEANPQLAKRQIGQTFSRYVAVLSFAAIVMICLIEEVLVILTPPEFWQATRLAQFDTLSIFFFSLGQQFSFGFYYTKDTKRLAYIRSVIAVGKVALSGLFIWFYGIWGAAVAGAVASFSSLVWLGAEGLQKYRFTMEWHNIWVIMSVCSLGCFATLSVPLWLVLPGFEFEWLHVLAGLAPDSWQALIASKLPALSLMLIKTGALAVVGIILVIVMAWRLRVLPKLIAVH
jgi:O-antigen/teichoic acid export membrane protein